MTYYERLEWKNLNLPVDIAPVDVRSAENDNTETNYFETIQTFSPTNNNAGVQVLLEHPKLKKVCFIVPVKLKCVTRVCRRAYYRKKFN